MNEHSYIRSVLRHLPNDTYRWKIKDDFAGGVPDVFIELPTHDLWVEFKYLSAFPKRNTTLIDLTKEKYLSKLQQIWLERRHHKRGDAVVILGTEFGGHIFTGLSWQTPISAGDIRPLLQPAKTLALEIFETIHRR